MAKNRRTPVGRPAAPGSARARLAAVQAEQQRRRRRRRLLLIVAAAVVVVLVVAVAVVVDRRSAPVGGRIPAGQIAGPAGPEGVPLEQGTLLAAAPSNSTGATVDGVQCQAHEQAAYHIHTHLAVYDNGALRPMPAGIGLVQPVTDGGDPGMYTADQCLYWLHVHAQDGIIHVEAPSQVTYTLGQFFAIWGQSLSATRVGPLTGTQTVYVDGRRYSGDPADIRLASRETVQIDVGSPLVPPQTIDWTKTGL